MPKIAPKIMYWDGNDVATQYHVRIIPNGTEFSYDRQVDVNVPNDTNEARHRLDLSTLGLLDEGVYDIYVTSGDAAGNESDPLDLPDVVLDFTPPPAPFAIGWE